ncbi:hypothetical protein ID866_6060 [Astraeus odoratus]|nr:hypothetical protein ID866_6060 [Astraeus odoratus]
MDEIAKELAQDVAKKLDRIPTNARLLIAVAGIPASGKSTLAVLLVRHINELLANAKTVSECMTESFAQTIMVGLDGWHFTRAQLDAMENPKLAHDRRGAHWTFDDKAYVAFVHLLRAPVLQDTRAIYAPSFDHALKDPTPHAVVVQPHHRVVVIEGLYTMLDVEGWRDAAEMMDERWWVEVDWEVGKERLIKRHVRTGVAKDMEEAIWRANENDEPSKS